MGLGTDCLHKGCICADSDNPIARPCWKVICVYAIVGGFGVLLLLGTVIVALGRL
jgi:hypothetical protein